MQKYLDNDRNRVEHPNENLAREVLELHTLGVGGPYDQTDVRELAELFTGMTFNGRQGFKFRKDFSEPGAETVLGASYGPKPGMAPIWQVLEDPSIDPLNVRSEDELLAICERNEQAAAKNSLDATVTDWRTGNDVPMRDCTVMLDNEVIIDAGRVVDEKMIVERMAR